MRVTSSNERRSRKRRRDWLLLPVLCLLTVGTLMAAAFLVNKLAYKVSVSRAEDCLITTDESTGVRGIPNCRTLDKSFESRLDEYRFNACGDRSDLSCGPKPKGVFRVVLLGSSFAEGIRVPAQQSIADLLADDLGRITGRTVEVYSKGLQWNTATTIARRFQRGDIQSAAPDLVVWLVTPWDVRNAGMVLPTKASVPNGQAKRSVRVRFDHLQQAIPFWFHNGDVLRHFLFQDQHLLLQSYLLQGNNIDYLRTSETPSFSESLKQFDAGVDKSMQVASDERIPVVLCLVPERGQAAMLSVGEWPKGYDPYRLGEQVRVMALRHGAGYVDLLPRFHQIANPERFYLPMDGHPTPDGYKLISDFLAEALLKADYVRTTVR